MMIATIQGPTLKGEVPGAEHIAVHRQAARLMTKQEAGQWRTDAEWLLMLADAESEEYPANITENSLVNALAIIAAVDAELAWRKRKNIAHPADNPRWDTAFLSDLKQRVSIESMVAQTVDLRPSGARLKALCPFHSDKSPSLVVYPDDGGFYCFGCGAHGDVFTWAMFVNRMSFSEAVHLLAAYAGVDMPTATTPTITRRRVVQIGGR